MDLERIYLVDIISGYSPEIGRLISMMNYARHTTLETVKGLSVEELDYFIDEQSNSIGALLLHMACIEAVYQRNTFEKRQPTEDEKKRWGPAYQLGELGREEIKGNSLEYYIDILNEVREKTLMEFKKRDDSWLYEQTAWWGGKQANNYFKWFHVFEDEINHRGQIRWLRKRLQRK